MLGVKVYRQEATSPLPTGEVQVRMEFTADTPGTLGTGGTVTLFVGDEAVGVLRRQGLHEVRAANFQDAIDEVFELGGGRQGEMALEDDTVKTGEHGHDQAGKLGDEARVTKQWGDLTSAEHPLDEVLQVGHVLGS